MQVLWFLLLKTCPWIGSKVEEVFVRLVYRGGGGSSVASEIIILLDFH